MITIITSAFSLCLACSRSAPRISYGVIQLVYYQGQGAPEERFSFFVLAEDDDGIENLENLYLYHDYEGLRWQFSFEDWISFDDNGKTWIGSRAIAMPDNESLPRGQYRVVLVNKGGERTERTLAFDAPVEPRHPFPLFNVSEGNYTIGSSYSSHSFICYDGEGNVIRTVSVENLSGAISSLGLSSNVRALALWAEDAEYQTSALTDLIAIR
ncbi:MAG: hypothetical protein LBD79_06635 [Treponema sp.]|nr:hypothetical protein [Treponema sp.]